VLAVDGEDVRDLPLSMRKANLDRLLRGRPDGIFLNPFEIGAIGPDYLEGQRDPIVTINRLIEVLDSQALATAMQRMEKGHGLKLVK
jgi:hypothetical protein